MTSFTVTQKYISPNAQVRLQSPDPLEADLERTYNRDVWMEKLGSMVQKYNMKIAQPMEKWETTYASELPSGLPPAYWDSVPAKPTFYEGTKTDTGLERRMITVDPASAYNRRQTDDDLKRNNSPPRQKFVHRQTWNNKNRAGY